MSSIQIYDSNIESPEVTIAIPTYKRGDLLIEAIESALNQENFHCNYDILVVDNNPERGDVTEVAMEKYSMTPNVAYYKNKENLGPIGNWNRLYEVARGKYVVILHDDDMLFPYYLEVMFSLLRATDFRFELVYPSFHICSERQLSHNELPSQMKYRVFKREDYIVTQWGLPSGMMILKSKFSQTGGFTMDYYPINDQLFIYRALGNLNGCVIYFPLIHYYIGVNESMKFEILEKSIIYAREFNRFMRKDKKNSWRYFAYISYRNQIRSQLNWASNFVDEDTQKLLLKSIGFRNNWLMDRLSFYFVLLLKKYLNKVRIHYFLIMNQ